MPARRAKDAGDKRDSFKLWAAFGLKTRMFFVSQAEHLSISLPTCCRPGKLRCPNTNKNELRMQKQRKQGSCHSWHSEKQNAKNDGYLVLSSKEDPCEELCNCNIQKKIGHAKYESVVRIWDICSPTATAPQTIFEKYPSTVKRLQSRTPTKETLSHPMSCWH